MMKNCIVEDQSNRFFSTITELILAIKMVLAYRESV